MDVGCAPLSLLAATDPISEGTAKKRERDGRRLVAYRESRHHGEDIVWDAVFSFIE